MIFFENELLGRYARKSIYIIISIAVIRVTSSDAK